MPGLTNKVVNSGGKPVAAFAQLRKAGEKDAVFYLVAVIVLMLAFLKYLYSRYFTNLFRVFFNTSLRQSQLTDQLLIAKLPSLLFNLFFVVIGGVYIFFLLRYYGLITDANKWSHVFWIMGLLGSVYFLKYCILRFTGWITGLQPVTNTYVFVTFLINKIIGIFLVPFTVVLAFSNKGIVKIAVLVSLMSIAVFLLMRFFRSYGLLQHQIKISRFHFLLYITGVELIPLLLIYKGLMVYLGKNL